MIQKIKPQNSIEKLNDSVSRNRENFSILKGIDEGSFDKLIKGFGSEKEKNQINLSGFLNGKILTQLENLKIDINHIQSYIPNKPDISKDLEIKIAKLFLKKLYESGATNIPFITKLKEAFNIENKKDIDSKKIDFQTIQVNIQKFSDEWSDNINFVFVSNGEIFDLLGNNIQKNKNFDEQDVSSRQIILDLLQFEVKGIIDYVKSWGEKADKDMENAVLPINNISNIFDEIQDSEIEKLGTQKGKIEEFLFIGKFGISSTEKTFLKEKINELSSAGFDDQFISKMKKLLLGKIEYSQVKNFLQKEIKIINKKIWKKYIESFENNGKDPEFIKAMKKLYSNEFDFSTLDKTEQTKLWQTLIVSKFDKNENSWVKYVGINQEKYKSFLKHLYDFEKEKVSLSVAGAGSLNLNIKKEVIGGQNSSFLDPDKFKYMDKINPIRFTVNIDNNSKNIIHDLEDTKDSPLRVNGIIETHITKGGELNIGNGYKLEICGKEITKSQLDQLLECDYDDEKLNKKLKEFGLYDELRDNVISTKKRMFNPENVYYDYDENGVAQNNDHGYGPYGYKYCIFEEMLKNLDVKVLERNLIFEGQNINKLSQLYIMSKLGLNAEKEEKKKNKKVRDKQDENVRKLFGNETLNDTQKEISKVFDADRSGGEEKLAGKEAGEEWAEDVFKKILNAYDLYDSQEESERGGAPFCDFLETLNEEEGGVSKFARDKWTKLNKDGKNAFKEKLKELSKDNEDKCDGISEATNTLLANLEREEEPFDPKKAEKELNIEFKKEKEKTEKELFLDEWKKLSGDKSVEKIEKGVRLYLDLGVTQLQPKDVDDAIRSYYCFKVVEVGEKDFTIQAIGGDLKSSLVGEKFTLNMTVDQLKNMKKGGDVFRVRPRDKNDWNSCLESINNAGFFKKITAFGNMEGQVKLSGNKFVNEKGEEIKYFDRVEGIFDDSKEKIKDRGQGQKIYKYEIKKIDTNKGTVKIASNFSDFENGEPVKYAYENEMTFEQFILLMEGKRLKGYTELEQKQMETKYTIDDPGRLATKGMRKWVSIGSIINVFKNATKTIKSKIEERRKDQEEDIENYLYSQEGLNIYGKIGALFGNSTIGDSARKLQYEFYTNRENRTWKRIEERYKIFQADPNYSELYKQQLIPILSKPGYRGDGKDRYKFAAAFLMMLKKEGPCPRDFTKEIGKGNWVEKFLGPEHKVRFLNFYEKKKNELEQTKDMGQKKDVRLDLQEELNKLEYMYIFNTIEGNAPHGPESNEYMLKSIWSTKFSGELKANLDNYYEKHNETKKEMKTFYAAEEQYLRTVGAGRFNKALPSLERMLELANTPGEVFRAKGYLLAAMLTGIIKNNSTKDTLKSFWGTARAIGFAPGYWIVDTEEQDKVKILLDGVTNGKFSKEIGFDMDKYNPGNLQDGSYEFLKKFQGYWNGNGGQILKKIENPSYKNESDPKDRSIIEMSKDEKNPNSYVFKSIIENTLTNEIDRTNPDVNSLALYQKESPLSATNNTMKRYIPNKGQYSRVEKEEDRADAESFWQSVIDKKCIPTGIYIKDKNKTDFLFQKYFNRFNNELSATQKEIIVRSIPLIKECKEKGEESVAKYMLWYVIKGTMHSQTSGSFPKEFEKVMNDFVDFFFDNIKDIDKSTIKQTFKGDEELIDKFDHPYRMFNWKEYRKYKMNNLSSSNSSTRSRYTKLINLEIRRQNFMNRNLKDYQELSDNDYINKHIESIRKNCDKYGVSPNVNILGSDAGTKLDVKDKKNTNDGINQKDLWLDKLEEYYDKLDMAA